MDICNFSLESSRGYLKVIAESLEGDSRVT